MSEPVSQPRQQQGGVKGALTRRIGPLPAWGWVGIIAAIVVGWAWWHNRKTQQAASSSDTGTSSQVPQFVNQVYTSPQPPEPPETPPGDHDRDDRRHRRKHPTHDKDKQRQPVSPGVGQVPTGGGRYAPPVRIPHKTTQGSDQGGAPPIYK